MADKSACSPPRMAKSTRAKTTAAKAAKTKTITVVSTTSRRVGQTTFETSERTCWINWSGLVVAMVLSSFLSLKLADTPPLGKFQGSVLRRYRAGIAQVPLQAWTRPASRLNLRLNVILVKLT